MGNDLIFSAIKKGVTDDRLKILSRMDPKSDREDILLFFDVACNPDFNMDEKNLKRLYSLGLRQAKEKYIEAFKKGLEDKHLQRLAEMNEFIKMGYYIDAYEQNMEDEKLLVMMRLDSCYEAHYYFKSWKNGYSEKDLKILEELNDFIKMDIYIEMLEEGLSDKQKEKVLEYKDKKSHYMRYCYKGISMGLDDKELNRLLSRNSAMVMKNYLEGYIRGMRRKELNVLLNIELKKLDFYMRAFDCGIRGNDLTRIVKLDDDYEANIYINGYREGMRNIHLERLVLLRDNYRKMKAYLQGYTYKMNESQLTMLYEINDEEKMRIFIETFESYNIKRDKCLEKLSSLNTVIQMQIYLNSIENSPITFGHLNAYSIDNIKKYVRVNNIDIDESLLDEILDDN